jgi:hypothetical protein
MKKIKNFAIAMMFLIFTSSASLAVSCKNNSFQEEYNGAHSVFSAIVLDIQRSPDINNNYQVTLHVTDQWKNINKDKITVIERLVDFESKSRFSVKKKYIVFAQRFKSPDVFQLKGCDGVYLEKEKPSYVDKLKTLKKHPNYQFTNETVPDEKKAEQIRLKKCIDDSTSGIHTLEFCNQFK